MHLLVLHMEYQLDYGGVGENWPIRPPYPGT